MISVTTNCHFAWLDSNGMCCNCSKTVVVIFDKFSRFKRRELKIGNDCQISQLYKNLGYNLSCYSQGSVCFDQGVRFNVYFLILIILIFFIYVTPCSLLQNLNILILFMSCP